MRHGLAAPQHRDSKLVRPHFVALLVESLDRAHHVIDGLPMLEEALSLVESKGDRDYQAELHRLKGELLLGQSADRGAAFIRKVGSVSTQLAIVNAQHCFRQAIKTAQRQKAKSLASRVNEPRSSLLKTGQTARHGPCSQKPTTNSPKDFDTLDLRESPAT